MIPAPGDALAVDRERFRALVEGRIQGHPNIAVAPGEVTALPEGDVVVATGPLTSEALTAALNALTGEKLAFYDAIAPIVADESVDHQVAFRASRYGKGGGDDYLNLPMDEATYRAFVTALREGEKVKPHAFEEPKYFEGCLPIEVMAERGDEVLAYGPMKPVGLDDPRTGRRPWAVVQLRMEDRAGTAWNLVGFQTRLTWPEQKRIFSMIPGLERAEWLRLGQIHRNPFIDGPKLLAGGLALAREPRVTFAGQITGVEGYVESTAMGLLAGLSVHARRMGAAFAPPPGTTALGALLRHVTGEAHPEGTPYQPTNVVYALFPPLPGNKLRKADRRAKYAQRASADLDAWLASPEGAVSAPPGGPAAVAPLPVQGQAPAGRGRRGRAGRGAKRDGEQAGPEGAAQGAGAEEGGSREAAANGRPAEAAQDARAES